MIFQIPDFANPDAAVYISRRRVNDAFLRAALESFHKDGPAAFEKCARENPASYLKIFALLVPRELKIEHANPASALSDEQLALMIAELEERIARRLAESEAKLKPVEATAIETTALPVLEPPSPTAWTIRASTMHCGSRPSSLSCRIVSRKAAEARSACSLASSSVMRHLSLQRPARR